MSSRVVQIRERKQCASCQIPFDPAGDEVLCPTCDAWERARLANDEALRALMETELAELDDAERTGGI